MANQLEVFITLTGETHQLRNQLPTLMGGLVRWMRDQVGRFPYIWVPEGGDAARGLDSADPEPHVHALLPAYAATLAIDRWPHGFTDPQPLRSLQDRRKAAEYVAKGFEVPQGGRQRYRVGRGFHPEAHIVTASSFAEFEATAAVLMGREDPPRRIRLGDVEDHFRAGGVRLEWDECPEISASGLIPNS